MAEDKLDGDTEPSGFERRKAETRRKITAASEVLFKTKGYHATSIEEIAEAAHVAPRTVYLRFGSKAGVLLAYFDAWLDEFVRQLLVRPAGERPDEQVAHALRAMSDAGWDDESSAGRVEALHPIVEFIGSGDTEVAGHVMQRWTQAQDALTAGFRERDGHSPESFVPRIQAAAVFASWVSTILVVRDAFASRARLRESSHEIGALAMRAYCDGLVSPAERAAAKPTVARTAAKRSPRKPAARS
jgi:AcrR family transcriptional regulator